MSKDGRGNDPAVLDYAMSEKFGPDWKNMEVRRAGYLIHLMRENQNRAEKNERGQADEFRSRM